MRAVVVGTAIAALIPFGLFVAMVLSGDLSQADVFELVFVGTLSVVIPFVFVVIAATVIGLPSTMLLSAVHRESALAYSGLGAAAGAVIILGLFGLPSGWLLPAGAVAGGATGYAWWRNRAAETED